MNPLFPGAGPSGRSSSSNAAAATSKATQPGSPQTYAQSLTNKYDHSKRRGGVGQGWGGGGGAISQYTYNQLVDVTGCDLLHTS